MSERVKVPCPRCEAQGEVLKNKGLVICPFCFGDKEVWEEYLQGWSQREQ